MTVEQVADVAQGKAKSINSDRRTEDTPPMRSQMELL